MRKRWAHCKPAESVEWPTPPELYAALDKEFGFDFDPCPIGGFNDGLSRLFMPWYGTWCNSCGWVDENSRYYLGAGLLKVRGAGAVLETKQGLEGRAAQPVFGVPERIPGPQPGQDLLCTPAEGGGGLSLFGLQSGATGRPETLSSNAIQAERPELDLPGVPPPESPGTDADASGGPSGIPESPGRQGPAPLFDEGPGAETAAIRDGESQKTAAVHAGSISVDSNRLATVQDPLGDDVRLLRQAGQGDPGPFHPAGGFGLSGDRALQHGPGLPQLQHEQTEPEPFRMVRGQKQACPDCGRSVRAKGYRCYINPPYGPGLSRWLERARDAELAVVLIPSRTDTRVFHEQILPFAAEIRFIQGRLKFGKAQSPAPFASMLVIFDRPPLPGQMRMPPILTSMKAPNAPLPLGAISDAVARNGRGNH